MPRGNADRRLLQADVVEQELPGIGMRYELDAVEGGTVSVTVHHSGRRDVYVLDRRSGEPRAAVVLSDAQARTLGAVLARRVLQARDRRGHRGRCRRRC